MTVTPGTAHIVALHILSPAHIVVGTYCRRRQYVQVFTAHIVATNKNRNRAKRPKPSSTFTKNAGYGFAIVARPLLLISV